MHSFKTVLALLVAAMVNIVFAVPGLDATAMILATTFVDAVVSSGFQHTVIPAPGRNQAPHAKPMSYTAGCFNATTFPQTGSGDSTLVPWTALTNESDHESELAVFHTFSTICKKTSATILTRDIPYTHCESDSYTNGTYGIIGQMMYLGPQDTYDMRGNYDLCLGIMDLPFGSSYGGLFEEVYFWHYSPNDTQHWNVQARAIQAPCPDCTGGLLVWDAHEFWGRETTTIVKILGLA